MKSFWCEKRAFIALTLSVLTLTTIIDVTIVSVALSHIMGSIGANTDQASWILSGYVIAATICMPLSGIIAKLIGRKKAILICCILFAATSVLCGMSTSLSEIVFFRVLQGIGGAFIPTLSMGYIIDSFNDKERPKVISVYTLMLIAGPIAGPVLGGFITQHLEWRWIFYVNVPICLLCFIILAKYMKESKIETIKIDYISFFFLCIGIGFIEFFLNDGNIRGWFSSETVTLSLVIGVVFMAFFIWRAILGKSVIDFRIFKYKKYFIACILLMLYMCLVYGVVCYFPLFLENSFKLPVETAGFMVAPRGIVAIIATPILFIVCKKIDVRYLVMASIIFFGISNYLLILLPSTSSTIYLVVPEIFQGLSMALFYMPLMIIAYYKFPKELSNSAGGMYSFFQMLGSSFGAAVGAILITHMKQVNWHSMIKFISPYGSNFNSWLQNSPIKITHHSKILLSSSIVNSSSVFLSYLDTFYFSLAGCIILCLVPLFFNKINKAVNQQKI
ncbi:MAG: DHA2 family efflux MFS transporter permease subunit [bacterium]|nr:DHA2 family efflux MFS transporter permease subunit [bacterium]